jgi:tetratricopeptide (TPR) repeat protein
MPKNSELFEALRSAHQRDQIGYARHLCELHLQEYPDHVPTLINYACNLTSLAQYSAAQKALDHAQAIVPQERLHLVLAQRGHLLEAEGDFSAAEEMFMRAHELLPDDADYLIYAGLAAFKRGDINRAAELDGRAKKCSEGCIDEAYFNLGGCLLSTRQYSEAADCYRKALEIDPDYEIAKKRLTDVELILEHQISGASSHFES